MPTIQNKRGTAATLASVNPILAAGEIVFEIDTQRFKVGDGVTAWNTLVYVNTAGPSGSQGVQGIAGSQGTTGTAGSQGVQGITGSQGVSGSAGSQGVQGITGSQGITGTAGSQGVQGISGINDKTFILLTPRENQPPASLFATLDTRNSILVLDFDDGSGTNPVNSNETAVFLGVIPDNANLTSGLQVRINWMATSATTGNCRWGVQFEDMNTDADADSFDTATEAHSATNGTSGVPTVTILTCTTIDSLAAGDFFRIRVYRDSSDTVNDTMTGDAELISVEVRTVA
jgi:hypothetical protein